MNIVLCEQKGNKGYDAGNKARSDVLEIAIKLGFKHIKLFDSGSNKAFVIIQMIKGTIKAIVDAKKNEHILIQYPYYPIILNSILLRVLKMGRFFKHYKIIVLIHDIVYLRYLNIDNEESKRKITKEIKVLKGSDSVIVHNSSMGKIVSSILVDTQIVNLEVFDYLYDGETAKKSCDNKKRIIIAGRLNPDKCGYIYNIPASDEYIISLYGIGYEKKENKNQLVYNGKYEPNELINHLYGDFGLVWDGDSSETCSGFCGQYLRFNNPHKVSLYIAAGLPIIVWSKSAIAPFIRNNKIGICVDSLNDLESELKKISEGDYLSLCANLANVRQKVIQGHYLQKSLKRCIDKNTME